MFVVTLTWLLASLLLSARQASSGATTFPAIVEVDLIFPRNDTYAPSAIFPIVFAFQNSSLVPSLDPGFDLNIRYGQNFSKSLGPAIPLKATNLTNGTTYVYTYVTGIKAEANDTPASYLLSWSFGAGNCSNTEGAVKLGGGWRDNGVGFTIKNGAQTPDLGSSVSSCASASHLAFNVTKVLDVPLPSQYDGHKTCAVFSDEQPLVPGNPCAANPDTAAQSSISAALTATACTAATPVVSCPASHNGGSRDLDPHHMAVLGVWTAAAAVVAGCL